MVALPNQSPSPNVFRYHRFCAKCLQMAAANSVYDKNWRVKCVMTLYVVTIGRALHRSDNNGAQLNALTVFFELQDVVFRCWHAKRVIP